MKKLLIALITVITLFSFVACNDTKDDSEATLTEAKKLLVLDTEMKYTVDFELPSSIAKYQDVKITWSSSNSDVVSIEGNNVTVTRQAEDTKVKLTATLKLDDKSTTKEFNITVAAKIVAKTYTVAEAKALSKDSTVKLTAKVIGFVNKGKYHGFYVGDETENMFVFTGTTLPSEYVEVGKVYNISGVLDLYYGMPQLKDSTIEETTDSVTTKAATVGTPTDVFELLNDGSIDRANYASMYTVTGKIVQADDATETPRCWLQTVGGTDKIELFSDASGYDTIIENLGLEITADVILHSYHSQRKSVQVSFVGTSDDITEREYTDAEKVEIIKDWIPTNFTSEIVADTTITIPTTHSIFGGTITWTSSDEAIINPTTGAVVIPETVTDVTLTATVTLGTETTTVAVSISIGELPVSTVAQALAANKNDLLKVEGVITSTFGTYTTIEDADGTAIMIYDSTGNLFDGYAVGDKIKVDGSRAEYASLPQISSVTKVEKISSENTITDSIEITLTEMIAIREAEEMDKSAFYKRYKITDLKFISADNSNTYINDADAPKIGVVFGATSVSKDDINFVDTYTATVVLYGTNSGGSVWRLAIVNQSDITVNA